MLQPNHRGSYEYLWSEHKFVALSISLKTFQVTAGKLGKVSQSLVLLRRLLNHALAEKPELLVGKLNAYMQIKNALSREKREKIIETILNDQNEGSQMIFSEALSQKESALYGCRLFYPPEKAIYKFWDPQEQPGLWICFGPFQLHLGPEMIFWRIVNSRLVTEKELITLFDSLWKGVPIDQYNDWSPELRELLENNNLIALPGSQAMLHPRADFDFAKFEKPEMNLDIYHLAALTLERMWDNCEPGKEMISYLPDYEEFKRNFNQESLPGFTWEPSYSPEEAFEFLANVFFEQKQREVGQKASCNESVTNVGMDTANQQVDSEKGEHGYDEPED